VVLRRRFPAFGAVGNAQLRDVVASTPTSLTSFPCGLDGKRHPPATEFQCDGNETIHRGTVSGECVGKDGRALDSADFRGSSRAYKARQLNIANFLDTEK